MALQLPFRLRKKSPVNNPLARGQTQANPGPQVFSYYASRRQREHTPAVKRRFQGEASSTPRGPRLGLRSLPTVAALVLIAGSIVYMSTLSARPRVRVRVNGSTGQAVIYREHAVYQALANEAMGKSVWNRSKLTLRRDAIEQALEAKLPELESVRLVTPLVGRELIITLETQPSGLVVRSMDGSMHVIDRTGTAIGTAAEAPSTEGLPVIEDQTGAPITAGQPAFAAQEVRFMAALHAITHAQELQVTSYTLPRDIANELHVRFEGQAYFVKYALNGDVRLQSGTYVAVKRDLARQGITPAEYLDVRVEGRAYYK